VWIADLDKIIGAVKGGYQALGFHHLMALLQPKGTS